MKQAPEWNPQKLLQSPLFAPLQNWLAELDERHFPTLEELNGLLASGNKEIKVSNGKLLQFVEQVHGKLPLEAQYEPRCFLEGEVQTRRDNWHDLFNALVWLAFPATKAAINARHYQAQVGEVVRQGRGSRRDMLTLFDESGVVVACADDELAGLLREFRWKELFWQRREQVEAAMGFYLFGHGLYEKAMQPYVGMTGQGLLLAVETDFFEKPLPEQLVYLDQRLAAYLANRDRCHSTRELDPVPLLGIPGWATENNESGYYDNTAYFRAGRSSSHSEQGR